GKAHVTEQDDAAENGVVGHARSDLRGGRHGLTHVHHGVADLVLDGVAGLVGGDTERGQAGAAVVHLGEREALVDRIVVVGELAGNLHDLDVGDAGGAHDGLGGLAAGDATARGNAHVLVVGTVDARLRIQAEEHGNDDENDPDEHGDGKWVGSRI